jgi:uncharacterized protein (TIGR00369 family)
MSIAVVPNRQHYLDQMIAGTAWLPPCVTRLALPAPTSWAPRELIAEITLDEELALNQEAIFGGYIACLVDHYAGLVMMTVLPPGGRVVTAGLDVRFLAPLRAGAVRVEATITRLGSRQAVVEVVFVQDGRTTGRATVEQVIPRPLARAEDT